ncbi:MAG: arylsulfotransferase family protein [Candidatus Eremiobacteraeota bacterium]|nr:arylsulfotransferase family protein [Candidatus Eremiobacteraeota bacterium]
MASMFQQGSAKVLFWVFILFCLVTGAYLLTGGDPGALRLPGGLFHGERREPPWKSPAEPMAKPLPTGIPAAAMTARATGPPDVRRSPEATAAPASSSEPQDDDESRLMTLPYLTRAPSAKKDLNKRGVVAFRRGACAGGLNLYASNTTSEAYLMDMEGKRLHTWRTNSLRPWQNVAVDPDGNLLFLEVGFLIGKLDWGSRPIWSYETRCHHWISAAGDGDIYTLSWERLPVDHKGRKISILNDSIIHLSPWGTLRKRLSLYESLGTFVPQSDLDLAGEMRSPPRPGSPADIFHTNTVFRVEREVPGVCSKGDLLISMKQMKTIAFLDPEKNRVVWRWQNDSIEGVHSPVLLANNHILFVDNGGIAWQYCRVLELDPLTGKIVYEYRDDSTPKDFASSPGSVEVLGNGNMLITESTRGRVFEVTRKGSVVWDFFNPEMDGTKRSAIFRMTRLSPSLSGSLMEKLGRGNP